MRSRVDHLRFTDHLCLDEARLCSLCSSSSSFSSLSPSLSPSLPPSLSLSLALSLSVSPNPFHHSQVQRAALLLKRAHVSVHLLMEYAKVPPALDNAFVKLTAARNAAMRSPATPRRVAPSVAPTGAMHVHKRTGQHQEQVSCSSMSCLRLRCALRSTPQQKFVLVDIRT